VVVGTHGLGGARKLVFGSTTARALQRAKVPVLAVPPAAIEKAPSPSWPGRRILAAVDFNAQTAADLRSAAQVAHAFDARLVVVHVLKPVSAPRWLTATIVGQDRARLDEARTALERLVRPLKPTAATECRVLVGEPGEELPSVAAAAKTGLILVTLRKEQGMLGAPQGSVTYDVLRHATVPVLALPGGRSASRR
jgi:nucleotide-binding universal stress UspA family protein